MQIVCDGRVELALPMRIAINAHRIDAVESVVMYFFTLLSAFDSVRCVGFLFTYEVTANGATGHGAQLFAATCRWNQRADAFSVLFKPDSFDPRVTVVSSWIGISMNPHDDHRSRWSLSRSESSSGRQRRSRTLTPWQNEKWQKEGRLISQCLRVDWPSGDQTG